jgi:hypothetical protein
MTSIPSSGAAMWLPYALSAQSQSATNWISETLDTSTGLGLPHNQVTQDFLDNTAVLADTLAGAQQNQAQGLAALSIQTATARAKAELGKKIEELANPTSQPAIAPAPTSVHLADGSVLNLAKNTFTLADGSVLNITTGMKVIGVVVDVTA